MKVEVTRTGEPLNIEQVTAAMEDFTQQTREAAREAGQAMARGRTVRMYETPTGSVVIASGRGR